MGLPNLTGPQRRDFALRKNAINVEARTVDLSFSSTRPVPRFYGNETLSHERGAVDLSRFRSGAPLLVNHDPADQIGKIELAEIDSEAGKGRAVVRFSKSARAQEIFQDVQDGIRELVSVGYNVIDVKETTRGNFLVTKWEPLEISITAIPADTSVGVGRSYNMTDTETPEVREGANQREYENTMKLIATRAGFTDSELNTALIRGDTVENFRQRALKKMERSPAQPLGEAETFSETRSVESGLWNAESCIGMSETEIRRYSILGGLNSIVNTGRVDGLVAEASRAAEKQYRRAAPGNGFTVPWDVLQYQQRTMTTGSMTGGGFLVATELHTESFIKKLQNKAVITNLGARVLSGLRGDIAIPKETGSVTASWLSETGTVADSDMTLGQLILTPKRVASTNPFSKQLLIQAGPDIENLVRDSMAQQIALSWDLKAIAGNSAAGEPLGILNTTGLSTSVTFGAAATFAKIVEFETNLATSNADTGSIGFIVSPATRGKWKTAVKVTNQAVFLWENDKVNGYPAFATNQIPSGDKAIFGNFADLIIGIWGGGLDVVVDPYSLATSNKIRVTSQLHCDIGIARPVSFVISTDSAAQ